MAKNLKVNIDDKGVPINTTNDFITASHTLASTEFEEIELPCDRVAEVTLKSDDDFTIGESADAVGYPTGTDFGPFGLTSKESIWVKGASGQVISILYGTL